MKHIITGYLLFIYTCVISAQNYNTLDSQDPIQFLGDRIIYQNKEIHLGPKVFYVDGSLTIATAAKHAYVFNTFQEAMQKLTPGTEKEPMQVFIAPYVYWIDNPDDPEIRKGENGREPFGMIIKCPYLQLIGLNINPANVILASNRGQTQGAIGNFTMFDFWGDGLLVKDLTMGNFCNVDLEFPLKPQLNRKKRMSAITQAHVAYCHGDKIIADHVRFISRLNMNPLNGAKRILFNNCHMESTDDALTGTGVYLNCTLDFYAPRPFWRSDMGGAIFMNCDFYIRHQDDRQFFCKTAGPLSVIDCRYHAEKSIYAGWAPMPTNWLRCYQYNVTLNNQSYILGSDNPQNTVCLDHHTGLAAYRIEHDNKIIYNTYNLLRGNDDWDLMNVKSIIEYAGKIQKRDFTNIASCLTVTPLTGEIQTGKKPITLKAEVKRHNNFVLNNSTVKWSIQEGYEKYVNLSTTEGNECILTATNHDDETVQFTVLAHTAEGLACATELTVTPDFIDAPTLKNQPHLIIKKGKASINYELELEGRKDESLITWYRSRDAKGANAIPVFVSRFNTPQITYPLTKDDIGYYLMVTVQPKHLRCSPGQAVKVISASQITQKQVICSNSMETDFSNFPTFNQPNIIPGFWTVDGYKPIDTNDYDWKVYPEKEYWYYGEGINGAKGTGLLQQQKGARILYTPLSRNYQDMAITLNVDPSKTAGQGFGSATGQYLDLYIKFDTQTLTGYALRIVRTTKHSNAVDFQLMEYKNGVATPISNSVSTNCYRTDCTIKLYTKNNKLIAKASTATPTPEPEDKEDKEVKKEVNIEAHITINSFGGTGVQHTGSWGEGATMLHYLKVDWE